MKRILQAAALLLALCTGAVAADSTSYAAKSADFTVLSGQAFLSGWAVRESAGSADVATVILRHGADTDTGTGGVQCAASGGSIQVGGAAIASIELSANQSVGENYAKAISTPLGVCADVVAGTVDLTVYQSAGQ